MDSKFTESLQAAVFSSGSPVFSKVPTFKWLLSEFLLPSSGFVKLTLQWGV